MDPVILAAIIGAVSTVTAALITVWVTKRGTSVNSDSANTYQQDRVETPDTAGRRGERAAALYAEGQRYMDAGEWQQALKRFEEIQRLKPGYRETEKLLERIRQLRSPDRIEQPGASERLRQQTEGRPTTQNECSVATLPKYTKDD